MVLRQLSSLGVKAQAIIAGTSYALTKKTQENKEYFFRTEYMGRRRTTVSIYEVPSFLRDANLAAYMLQFGDIVSATHDGMRGEWRFDIMLDAKTFYSVPNWLEVEGRRLPVIISGRKPACWHSGEIGHLSAVCPGKKAPKKARPKTRYPPTCCIKHRKGDSRSLVTLRPIAPTRIHPLFEPFHFLRPAGDQLVVRGGQRTFLGTGRIRSGG